MEVEHDPFLWREQLEHLVDPRLITAPLERALGRLRPLDQAGICGGRIEIRDPDRGRASLARADPAERDVDADPVDPGRQAGVAAKPLEPAERDHEDLLDEILELAAIAEHAVEVARDLATEAVVELVLRRALVLTAPPDELGFIGRIHDGHRSGFALHSGQHSVCAES